MMTAARRLEYLDAMGVQVWGDRRVESVQLASVEAGSESSACNGLLYAGAEQAKVFIISGFPSAQDEQQASPFTGDESRLLLQITQALGLKNHETYVINSVDCQSTYNEKNDQEQLARCRDYLIGQVKQVAPSVVLVLGDRAANSLLKLSEPLTSLSETAQSVADVNVPIIVCEQLDVLIQQPLAKRQAWSALLQLKGLLG